MKNTIVYGKETSAGKKKNRSLEEKILKKLSKQNVTFYMLVFLCLINIEFI